MNPTIQSTIPGLWEKYIMALDEVTAHLQRITQALESLSVPYALVGGQAVALWVATRDPAAVRTTKDIDILLRRADLPRARAAALSVNLDYFEVQGVGMFLERTDPNPRRAVRLLWAGEKVTADCAWPSPSVEDRQVLEPGKAVVSLAGLVHMKLLANRDQDRVHLRDLIDVGLINRAFVPNLPTDLADKLNALLGESGR
jgi:hypothetical protein